MDQDDPNYLLDHSLWSETGDPFELELITNEFANELLAEDVSQVNQQEPTLSEMASVQGQEKVAAPDSPTSPDQVLIQSNSPESPTSPTSAPNAHNRLTPLRKVRHPQHHHQHLPLHP